MALDPLSTASLDYLQRSGISPLPLPPPSETAVPPDALRLVRARGVGILEKGTDPDASGAALVLSGGMLAGLHGHKVPVAFQLRGGGGGIEVHLGTWTSAQGAEGEASVTRRINVLTTLVHAAHPAVTLDPVGQAPAALTTAGLALGIPTAQPADPRDGSLPVDRLIRAMAGGEWAVHVLAEPVSESYATDLRASVINEVRAVQAASLSIGAPSPLAQYHSELLQATLQALTEGLAVGTWRVAVYLSGDAAAYHRLAGAWRGTFSGPGSLPEPLRIWRSDDAARLASAWSLPYTPAPPGPGPYRHPFLHQTLLTSTQLAAYVHLPQVETTGFSVTIVPDFDVVPPAAADGRLVTVGTVLERTRRTTLPYRIQVKDLGRHAFVAGVTGSGKTNTIFHLLRQVEAAGVPFLVLEPAKAEYRALLREPGLGERLAVFTVGEEGVSPLRLNPFEVLPGTSVGEHVDLLRSVFDASFGMWTPLPQVLERCLHLIYEERGWDVASGRNHRLDGAGPPWLAFPTLSDLVAAVDRVTPTLGYEERVTADIRAALLTRLNSLRQGGKGRMLDIDRSVPMEALLAGPTVLELESMTDDEDKAFIMGLLLVRLAEHRRAQGPSDVLEHVIVVEEAHRLLSDASGQRREEEADPRAKAVETFGNLLAEVRAYGQGVLIADQVPVKLAPDVVKNTNLKLAHRVVSADDRSVLAGTMAMTPRQERALTTLAVGQVAAFADGDDVPVLVHVPRAKGSPASVPDDGEIARRMRAWRLDALGAADFPPFGDCEDGCARDGRVCAVARRTIEEPGFGRTFARLVLSTIEDPGALDEDRLWPDLAAEASARLPADLDEDAFMRSLVVHASRRLADRRGAQARWTYATTYDIARALQTVLLSRIGGAVDPAALESFRASARALYTRTFAPYARCDEVCHQQPPLCLYRPAVADYVASGEQTTAWHRADVADAVAGHRRREESWEVALDAAYALMEFPEDHWDEPLRRQVSDAARRVALCFAQQMLDRDVKKSPRTVRRIIDKLLVEANR